MNKQSKLIAATILAVTSLFFAACGAKSSEIPYTELNINSTLEEMKSYEGENFETYYSIYEGTTYIYEKEYKGRAGRIKYMFDANDELMNIAWIYSAGDGDEADILYKEIYADYVKAYGEPADASGVNNNGAVWKRDKGNIILSDVISSEANLVQVAFLDPQVSRE